MRARPGCAELPIVMLVAPDSPRAPELAERALQAGATDFFIALPTWALRAARLRRHLRASRARLIKAQRIARMGSFEWNLRTQRLDHANGCARVLGFEPHVEHLDPRALVGLVHPDERDAVLQ